MKQALFLPIFDELAEPRVVASIAADAEAAGWDGVFVWDHIDYRLPVEGIADPWVTLAAMAMTTQSVRLGPMVTPLPRRRPLKVAREVVSLDRLSNGRVILGVGIGSDRSGELSHTGEELDDRTRGAMLDEGLRLLRDAWTGQPLAHSGEHYLAEDMTLRPTPVQDRLPVWVAVRYGNAKPLERAARHDGVFPIDIDSPDKLAETLAGLRRPAGPYDVAVGAQDDTDPRPYEAVGATWWMRGFSPFEVTESEVRSVLAAGPQR